MHELADVPIERSEAQRSAPPYRHSVLRVETTTNKPKEFKSRRRAEGDPDSETKLRPLRKGIADIKARARESAKANDRYLDSLATVDCDRTVEDVLVKVLDRAELDRLVWSEATVEEALEFSNSAARPRASLWMAHLIERGLSADPRLASARARFSWLPPGGVASEDKKD